MKRLYAIVALFFALTSVAFGQGISTSTSVTPDLHVCGDTGRFTVQAINQSLQTKINPELKIKLPVGISYSANSLTEISTLGLSAINTSVDTSLIFSVDSLQPNDTLSFFIAYTAGMKAIDELLLGGVFRNNLSIHMASDTVQTSSSGYNILYPAISILSINPSQATIPSGTTSQRTIRLVNGGYGSLNAFFITHTASAPSVQLDSTSAGTVSGDTISFGPADFVKWGNNDSSWDRNEVIEFVEHLTGTSCSDVTVTSEYVAQWGCETPLISSDRMYAHVTIEADYPQLSISTTDSFGTCYGAGIALPQQMMLVNKGAGVAAQTKIRIYKANGTNEDQTILNRIDDSSVVYRIGYSGVRKQAQLTTSSTSSSGIYACLGANPIGSVEFTIAQINPNDTVYLEWDMYSCCPSRCQNDAQSGWAANLNYSNECGTKTYNTSVAGQPTYDHYATFMSETPIDIKDQQIQTYSYLVSSFKNELPTGPGFHYRATFTLPNGLLFDSLRFHSNSTEWTPNSLDYDSANGTVQATYFGDAPFVIPKSELSLRLKGNCGNAGWKTIKLSFDFIADTTCSSTCAVPLVCDLETTTFLHCPSGNCSGVSITSYDLFRTNLGEPDNNLDGLADNSGSVDLSKIKRNRAIVGDTILSKVTCSITNLDSAVRYAFFESDIDYGSYLSVAATQLTFYDSSEGVFRTLEGIPYIKTTASHSGTFRFFLSMDSLSKLDSALSNLKFDNGDSLLFMIYFSVTGQVPGLVQEATFLNDFHLSAVTNPTAGQKLNCNFRNGRITLIGYQWRNDWPNNNTLKNCSRNVVQNFGLSIGSVGNNYAGGNLFPFEFRHFGHLEQIKVVLPTGYFAHKATLYYYRTVRTNSISTMRLNDLQPDTTIGDTLFYSIDQYFENGSLTKGDDGFHGRLVLNVGAECSKQTNTYESFPWLFQYRSHFFESTSTPDITASGPDKIRYVPANLSLIADNPKISAKTRLVVWDLQVKNSNNSVANNAWVHANPSSNVQIDSIVDAQTNVRYISQNGIYQLGNISSNQTKKLKIHASISSCTNESVVVSNGFSCDGYPQHLDSFNCPKTNIELFLDPLNPEFQTKVSTKLMADPCLPLIDLSIEVTNAKIAHLFDIEFEFASPDTSKIGLVDDFSTWEYLNDTSNASPNLSGSTYQFDFNTYDSLVSKTGLAGVLNIPENTLRLNSRIALKPGYVPGDYLGLTIGASNACKDSLPSINFAVDPNSKFTKDETAGLHLDIGNSWSASWGDYNNDGYDDLFVPINDLTKPNILYKNNGDGSFTKVSNSPIVDDLGASIAGLWGDYDNDGYLDLFVANNVNSSNQLYHNEGNGTFSRVEGSPISEHGIYTHAAAWSDYNRDGNLDLVITDYHPTHYNTLFIGDGNGGFEVDKTNSVTLSATSAFGVAWGDYDDDGDPDLFIANNNGENNQLFENKSGRLVEVKTGPVVNDKGHSVGGTWGDYDNDGDLDLYVTNARATEANFLYENLGAGSFQKNTTSELVKFTANSHGASWADYDNDGYLDLIVANDQNQPNLLFRNNQGSSFTRIHNSITQERGDAYGTSWSDYDNDGDYDVVIANRGDNTNDFFVNAKGSCTNHIAIQLSGCESNKSGVGATVKVRTTVNGEPVWQRRELSTQNSAMGGQNSGKLLFGLGTAQTVDTLLVLWPSGIQTMMTQPSLNTAHSITEPCGSEVCGVVFHDENNNQQMDSNERGIPNQKLFVTPAGIEVYTDNSGRYQFYSEDDTITIVQASSDQWSQTSPSSNSGHTIVVDKQSQSSYCGNDFGNSANCTSPDFDILVGTTALRRGLLNPLNVRLTNIGAYASSDSLLLDVTTSNSMYLVDSTWIQSTEDSTTRSYRYYIPSLQALSDTLITLTDSVDAYAQLEDTVTIQVKVIYFGTECDTLNNYAQTSDIIVGSIDPNDKHVFVDRISINNEVPSETQTRERLTYKIRFQNLGNYAARRVEIRDTLSPLLDWTSFKTESSSHPFSISKKGGIITWINNSIELPDSVSNPEGSQGYVCFSILAKKDILPYSLVRNTGHIQFDRNDFIATNCTKAYIGLTGFQLQKKHLTVFPNPTSSGSRVLLLDKNQAPINMSEVVLIDGTGRIVMGNNQASLQYTLNLTPLKPGLYTVKVTTVDGEVMTHKLIRI
ncbi:MAG: VCBS repeat-containing protein [Bacteroidia bacterium]|nr:VCBS repeat-containing protein [Bacteroidia bacterium]